MKNNLNSKFYNRPTGKLANILLCTHWHDSWS
ncbi:DUF5040 domain-containing protein [uncultured Bacteroides sp.]